MKNPYSSTPISSLGAWSLEITENPPPKKWILNIYEGIYKPHVFPKSGVHINVIKKLPILNENIC